MKSKTRAILMLTVITAMMLTALSGCSQTPRPTARIILLHTNDTHGRVVYDEFGIIGIDRIAAIHKSIPNSILLDAGDTLHGLPAATLNRGADIAALMKAAGYSAMTVGNHDFNYGWGRLEELRDTAGFPFLASNVTKTDGSQYLDDTAVIEVSGVKIGLLGITTEATAHLAMPGYVSGLAFADPVTTAKDKAALLQSRGVHLIVAVCHLGDEPYNGTLSTQLAREVPAIDIIIDGHSHTALPEGLLENGVLIAQAGDHGNSLGKVEITVENGRVISKTASLISFEEAQSIEPDETVAAMLAGITADLEQLMSEPVGESTAEMSSARAPGVRTQEMPLGNLIADAYRESADADIAIVNGGDIRADIVPGVITKGGVISVLPFGNTLMVKTVTPALLREVLENAVSGIIVDANGDIDHEQSPQGRFLQVSGFSFSYDPAAPEGERILSITMDDGRALPLNDNTTEITLAGSNYVMTGGDYYIMLAELPVDRELGAADEALAAYVAKHSPIGAPETGRIEAASAAVNQAA